MFAYPVAEPKGNALIGIQFKNSIRVSDKILSDEYFQ